MKYQIQQSEQYSLASITQKQSDLVVAYISIDIHDRNTSREQALQMIYADALLSGAGKLNREQFLDAVNKLGASIGISIGEGRLNITLKSLKSKFPELLKLTELMLLKPQFTDKELERIKKTTINELHEAAEDSKQISHNELLNIFYGQNDRKYTYEPATLIQEIKKLKKSDLSNLHKNAIGQIWTISIAAEESAVKKFELVIKNLKRKIPAGKELARLHQQKPPQHTTNFKNIPSRTNIDINFGAPIPITIHHPDFFPLNFAMNVLAKPGFSGRLMSTVREKEGLTYMIYGRIEGFVADEQGYWRIFTFFSPDKAIQGINSTVRELTKLFKGGVTKDEFDKFKVILKTQQTLLNDSVYKLLADLHAYHCQNFTLAEIKEFKSKIDTITIAEVNSAIKAYLDPKTFSLSCAGPITKVKSDIEKLIKK